MMTNRFVCEIIIWLLLFCCPTGQEFIYNVNNFPLICQVKKRQVCLKAENLSKFVPSFSFSTTFLSLAQSCLSQCPPRTSHSAYGWWAPSPGRGGGRRTIYTIKIRVFPSSFLIPKFITKFHDHRQHFITKFIQGTYGWSCYLLLTLSVRHLLAQNWQGRMRWWEYGSNWIYLAHVIDARCSELHKLRGVSIFTKLYYGRLWRLETAIKLWKYLP